MLLWFIDDSSILLDTDLVLNFIDELVIV